MIQFDVITIFPDIFDNYFNTSIIKRAKAKGLIKIKIHNLRDFALGRHKSVDDRPYGGGPGMILRADVLLRALKKTSKNKPSEKIILTSAAGKQFDQKTAYRYAKLKRIIFICGRYEGVDARIEKFIDEKVSVGPYVLTGGELPVMTMIDAVTRLIPGVIKEESLKEETFTSSAAEYAQYTRPEILTFRQKNGKIKTLKVPKILLSGHHKNIKDWRNK
ncbi:MAG: tRNA (guanosine(37)-N1)-methyltransferase TrmD [Patescibacteria group bacterium]|nr:tRNA (guanosine(37)-N1)-methyltransferase TrmD [Patescibacteria group bacterium]MDD5121164.1 tRNA (guanosine(37)-N1)-methyltransferase TrmD [Patescibacteria group bacterium]MDD5221679.1 tRNA (guanosine(37)-N1)-methyltransferase TrmD [Patescibacteria group bacterium]MDD5395917.1 tRNA (guanosine(37)-N1)-methyltransferase TrmD [Patescibacteria group bacterium]